MRNPNFSRLAVRTVAMMSIVASVGRARADGTSASKMAEAQAEFDAIDKSLAGASGSDCTTMCKALASLARATERICALAESGSDADKKRCADARARLEEATRRVRMACPGCSISPTPSPEPPTVVTTKPPEYGSDEGKAHAETYAPETATTMDAPAAYRRGLDRHFSLTFAPLRLFLPAYLVKGALEIGWSRVSLAIAGGAGSLPTSSDRSSAYTIGAQGRVFVAGSFGLGGLFFGVDATWAHAAGPIATRAIVPGLTVGPVAGFKLVVGRGFTIETHVGAGIVAKDDRAAGSPSESIVPTWDVRVGWTF